MYTAVGPVVHVTRDHLARFVGVRAFDDEDQFIADVLMARQLSARRKTHEDRAALGFLVLPDSFLLNPGHRFCPPNFTKVEILRGWGTSAVACRFNSAGDNREHGRAVF